MEKLNRKNIPFGTRHFFQKKYQNLNFIEDGGWHFTNIKTAEEIDKKMRNFAHHYEYEKSGLNVTHIKKNILEKKVFYNHFSDKKDGKFNFQQSLEKIDFNQLPNYISNNYNHFKEWID